MCIYCIHRTKSESDLFLYIRHLAFNSVFDYKITFQKGYFVVTRTKTSIRYAKENDREKERERERKVEGEI